MGREAGSMRFNPKVAFGPNQIIRYPRGTSPEALEHSYRRAAIRNGRRLPMGRAVRLLSLVHKEAVEKYEKGTGKPFDRFNLGRDLEFALSLYRNNPKFTEACSLLNLNEREVAAVGYPWANFTAADEAAYEHGETGGKVTIGPRHFFETQALRVSDLPIQSISVSSVLKTSDGKYAIGLRGGERFANVYHVFASALLLTEGIKRGTQSISDFNLNEVLFPETGVSAKEIAQVTLLSRIADWSGKDPMYNFLVELKITVKELNSLFARHRENSGYPQRTKYRSLVPIGANSFEIAQFLNNNYRGLLDNRTRTDEERAIIFPGAVTLFSLTDMPLKVLGAMHKEGLN